MTNQVTQETYSTDFCAFLHLCKPWCKWTLWALWISEQWARRQWISQTVNGVVSNERWFQWNLRVEKLYQWMRTGILKVEVDVSGRLVLLLVLPPSERLGGRAGRRGVPHLK